MAVSLFARARATVWIAPTLDQDSIEQGILVDPAILHDDDEILAGIGHDVDIFQGVAYPDPPIGSEIPPTPAECPIPASAA